MSTKVTWASPSGRLSVTTKKTICRSTISYVCPESSRELRRHRAFRDYLRSHPEAAAEYGAVKLEAAALYPEDIDGYMEHKSSVIQKLYRRCGLE